MGKRQSREHGDGSPLIKVEDPTTGGGVGGCIRDMETKFLGKKGTKLIPLLGGGRGG
jgi:hypothetical protein